MTSEGSESAHESAMVSIPEEITAASFFINETYVSMIYVNVDKLLEDCGGKLTFDSACSRSVGGIDWYRDLCARLKEKGKVKPIEYPEAQPFRFGASKSVKSEFAALIPCAVRGKGFTVRFSIVPSRVPGLLSRKAQDELDVSYHARKNTVDIGELNEKNVPMRLSSAGHPTLSVLDFPTEGYTPAKDVSDTLQEVRLVEKDLQQEEPQKMIQQWFCRTCRIQVSGNRCPTCLHDKTKYFEELAQDSARNSLITLSNEGDPPYPEHSNREYRRLEAEEARRANKEYRRLEDEEAKMNNQEFRRLEDDEAKMAQGCEPAHCIESCAELVEPGQLLTDVSSADERECRIRQSRG